MPARFTPVVLATRQVMIRAFMHRRRVLCQLFPQPIGFTGGDTDTTGVHVGNASRNDHSAVHVSHTGLQSPPHANSPYCTPTTHGTMYPMS